ncbi:hypothetical protein NM688_g1099 [Phlebia brevispora]|uniref:Uncharacterized protein n=1 Tax=Phlebia brevispora TaxID=194682 RepID=A0ACC1TCK9_9APHY|nr:hypothetical protein NM688_g1099 [Phlebia brevispora]
MCPTTPEEAAEMRKVPYANAVGALNWLATCTRPDIAYTVSQLGRFNANPGKQHWAVVKHLFRYLKATMDLKLTYSPDLRSKKLFHVFSDASFGSRGTGAAKLESITCLSTTEAEYIAAVDAGKEICWLRNLFTELGYSFEGKSSTLHMDNHSAITVAKNPEHFGRLKHLDLRWFWLRDVCEAGTITPEFVPTADMLADLLTKPLDQLQVARLRSMMVLELRKARETIGLNRSRTCDHPYSRLDALTTELSSLSDQPIEGAFPLELSSSVWAVLPYFRALQEQLGDPPEPRTPSPPISESILIEPVTPTSNSQPQPSSILTPHGTRADIQQMTPRTKQYTVEARKSLRSSSARFLTKPSEDLSSQCCLPQPCIANVPQPSDNSQQLLYEPTPTLVKELQVQNTKLREALLEVKGHIDAAR